MLEDSVSKWELDEIFEELQGGSAPDVVAFWHGLKVAEVRAYAKRAIVKREPPKRWTVEESTFVRDNYPNHGDGWPGWDMLQRSFDSIKMKAHRMGIGKRKRSHASGGKHNG